MNKNINKFKNKQGQSLAEYGLILALVSVIVMVSYQFLGESLQETFAGFTDKMQEANN